MSPEKSPHWPYRPLTALALASLLVPASVGAHRTSKPASIGHSGETGHHIQVQQRAPGASVDDTGATAVQGSTNTGTIDVAAIFRGQHKAGAKLNQSELSLACGSHTIAGTRPKRQRNRPGRRTSADYARILTVPGFADFIIVGDGMSDHEEAGAASRAAVNAVQASVEQQASGSTLALEQALEQAIGDADAAIVALRNRYAEGQKKPGSTILALGLTPEGQAVMRWLGDSPGYFGRDGKFKRLSYPHDKYWLAEKLSRPELAKQWSDSAVALFAGQGVSDPLACNTQRCNAEDIFLLGSDGLNQLALEYDSVEVGIATVLQQTHGQSERLQAQALAEAAFRAATDRNRDSDDVLVVLGRVVAETN